MLPCSSNIWPSGIYPREKKQYFHMQTSAQMLTVHGSIIPYNEKLEITHLTCMPV